MVTEFSDDDRWFHPQDFSHNNRWETAQELCVTNDLPAPLAYSNNKTLTINEAGQRGPTTNSSHLVNILSVTESLYTCDTCNNFGII